MKIGWNHRYYFLIIVGILLVVGSYFVGKWYFLSSVEAEVDQLKQNVENQEKLVSILQSKQQKQDASLITSTELQKKLPVRPVVDQLLLGLEQAEGLSQVVIDSVSIQDEQKQNANSLENQINQNDNEAKETLNAEIKKIKMTVHITAASFEEQMNFLEAIKALPRFINIDEINFSEPGSEKELPSSVTLTAFYDPTLNLLVSELPKYHYDGPADKTYPFER